MNHVKNPFGSADISIFSPENQEIQIQIVFLYIISNSINLF